MPSLDSNFLGIHGTALALREQRLQVLATNIANADTPGFRAQDMDFAKAMNAAMAPGAAANGADPIRNAAAMTRFDAPSAQPSLDGNTVDAERAKAAFAQASMEYQASMRFVESKVRTMLTAITGQ